MTIKLALQNRIRRADAAIPVAERAAARRAQTLPKAVKRPKLPLSDQERDVLWGV